MKIINPKWLSISILGIIQNLIKHQAQQIMLDGKAIKSTDAIASIDKMMNIVTAYTDTRISIGQKTVENKSNEIPAVQELLEMLGIEGMIITVDAMHCQKETAKIIVERNADYVLQLKANQGSFYGDVYAMFDDTYMYNSKKEEEYEIYQTIEKGHGRIETRTCYVLKDIEYFTNYKSEWKGLKKYLQ